MTRAEVKKELNIIRNVTGMIETSMIVMDRYNAILTSYNENLDDTKAELERVVISFANRVDKLSTLTNKYIDIILEMNPDVQQVMMLRFFNNMTYWEIARKIGWSEEWVKKRLQEGINLIVEQKRGN